MPTYNGTASPDTINGDQGGVVADDVIYGLADRDVLSGLDGNDEIYGGVDDDLLYGGDGNDRLEGGSYNDVITGGAGDDSLYGGDGTRDKLSYLGAAAGVTVDISVAGAQDTHGAGIDTLAGFEILVGSELTGPHRVVRVDC